MTQVEPFLLCRFSYNVYNRRIIEFGIIGRLNKGERFMLRRYISGFIAMRYITPEFSLAALIMIMAYVYGRYDIELLRYVILACTAAVVVILFLYTKDRIHTGRQLDLIMRQDDFRQCILLGYVFFLEDRLVAYNKGNVVEDDYSRITDATLLTGKKGKQAVQLLIEGRDYEAQVATPQQAERLAAFLKKKNPTIQLHDLKTKGPGTWKSIDLVPAEKAMLS